VYLGLNRHATNFGPIDETCPCPTCSGGPSRALLHTMITHETVAAHGMLIFVTTNLPIHVFQTAITQHNLVFQARLMGQARDAIVADKFPEFLRTFFKRYFGETGYPRWCVDALSSVGVDLLDGEVGLDDALKKVVEGDGARWEYSAEK
jgi:queuine tRNA-ribosyltransferase catalytic subunit